MPRREHIAKRDVLPDPVCDPKVIIKLTNNVMEDSEKEITQRIRYNAFQIISEETDGDAVEVFEKAMNNIMLLLEVKARRIGGANYQIPIEVGLERRQTSGLRWLFTVPRKGGEKYMRERLTGELMDATNNTGAAVKKREDIHKMAEADKAFAHYRH